MDSETAIERPLKATHPRKRMVVGALLSLCVVATALAVLVVSMPACGCTSKLQKTRTDAMTLRSAVELFMASGGTECPTVRTLVDEHIVNASTHTKDAWDHEFTIECRGNEFNVLSNGPDGQRGTEDDVSTN